MLIVVYVVDNKILSERGYPEVKYKDPDTRELFVRVSHGTAIPTIVHSIIHRKDDSASRRPEEREKKIDMIRVISHGNKGFLDIGAGVTHSNASDFKPLKPYMANPSTIELLGCGIASDESVADPRLLSIGILVCKPGKWTGDPNRVGYALLKQLAKATNSYVRAAINCQKGDKELQWEGPSIIVSPVGTWAMAPPPLKTLKKISRW